MKAASILERSLASARALAGMRAARRVPYLPRDRVEELRDRRVREQIDHAFTTVPHYRELVERGGLDPRELTAAADLARLPLLEKADLRSTPERLRDPVAATDGAEFPTSGSTGIPVRVVYDRAALTLNAALGARENAVVQAVCGKRLGIATLRFGHPASTGPQVREANRTVMLTPRSTSPSLSMQVPFEEAVEAIERIRPDVLTGYGTFFETLFRSIGQPSGLRHRPRAVIYRGTPMSADGRRLIESGFGIKVLARYNAVECFKIGYLCEKGTGFHVHEDVCHVRIVDPDGNTLEPGVDGEVVISNLFNRATVLLNYRLGDIAALATEPCPCGRTSPRLVGLEGRLDEVIQLPNGRRVDPVSVSIAVRGTPILQFQLAQLAPDRFELRLVTIGEDAYEQAARAAVPELERLLGTRVVARRCERLETQGRGKLRRILTLPRESADDR